jgi:hypothetical protein
VEAHGLIQVLSFGDYVLLQAELLDNYASAMARAAREQPDGLGFLDEQAAREDAGGELSVLAPYSAQNADDALLFDAD